MKYSHLDIYIRRQAIMLNRNDDLIKHIAECLKQRRVEEATRLAVNHMNNQRFKGNNGN